MADFFFFTDTDLLLPQAVDKAYGPVSGFENSKYRLCSIHSASSDSNAYAICSGTVFIQVDNSDPNLLNLILRPFVQPDVQLPHIAYFIYRGIRKDSLIAIGGTEIAASATNDLTNSIWDSQNKRNESIDQAQGTPPGTTTDTPPVELLGVNFSASAPAPYALMDFDSLNGVFFRTNVDYQLESVEGGWNIGKFNATAFSLEIVFETLGHKVIAQDVRINDNVFSLTPLTGSEAQPDTFTHWNSKEKILSYIDPAAFFGSFYVNQINAKASTDTSFTSYSGDYIYNELLSSFVNKGRVYLDVRNEFNNSLNFFGNYGNDIMLAFDNSSALATVDYYRANWPILIIDSDFPAGNTSTSNTLRLTLPVTDNDFPRLYIHKAADVKSFPVNIKGATQLKNLQHSGSGFTINEIFILTPNYVTSDTTPIANYLRVAYLRSYSALSSRTSQGTRVHAQNAMDNLFNIPALSSIDWEINGGVTQTQIYNDTRFVDMRMFNRHSFLAKHGVSKDPDGGYLFFAFSVNTTESDLEQSVDPDIRSEGASITSQGAIGDSIGASFVSVAAGVNGVLVALEHVFSFYGADREGKPFIQNPSKFAYVKLGASEYNTILTTINDPGNAYLTDFPIWLGMRWIAGGIDDAFDNSYYCLELYVTGYYLNTSSNEIEVKVSTTGIKSYRLQSYQSLISEIDEA